MDRRAGQIGGIACACLAVAMLVVAGVSYFRFSSMNFSRHGLQWEIVLHRGRIRVDNEPELDFERRDLVRLQRVVDGRARAYMATMLDGPRIEGGTPVEIAVGAQGVVASQKYAEAQRELAHWGQIYVTQPVSHGVHLAIPIVVLLVPPLWQFHILIRRRNRARSGLCVACGYDIRATPDRCSECGRPVPVRLPGNQKSGETLYCELVPQSPVR